MGNYLFSFGSSLIDFFGFGYTRKQHYDNDDGEESDDDIDRNERIVKNVEEMESYCKPLLFVRFKGQTTTSEVRKREEVSMFMLYAISALTCHRVIVTIKG